MLPGSAPGVLSILFRPLWSSSPHDRQYSEFQHCQDRNCEPEAHMRFVSGVNGSVSFWTLAWAASISILIRDHICGESAALPWEARILALVGNCHHAVMAGQQIICASFLLHPLRHLCCQLYRLRHFSQFHRSVFIQPCRWEVSPEVKHLVQGDIEPGSRCCTKIIRLAGKRVPVCLRYFIFVIRRWNNYPPIMPYEPDNLMMQAAFAVMINQALYKRVWIGVSEIFLKIRWFFRPFLEKTAQLPYLHDYTLTNNPDPVIIVKSFG